MSTQIRTCTVMVYADGQRSVYHVMRGPVSKYGDTFYAHEAETIATYTIPANERPDYADMTARYATPDAPAVKWQRKET